jgi:hypothetical protein
MSLRRFWSNNSLSIVIFSIFAVTIVAMSIVGHRAENNEREDHKQSRQSYGEYITSGTFVEGVFENWESEFLQMWALVVLTIYLKQKGSADSKPLRGKEPVDTSSRYSIIRARSFMQGAKAMGHRMYSHSLSLALVLFFVLSFVFHAVGGAGNYNQQATEHGGETLTPLQYIGTSQFWYESFQNWQSEFLAVGVLLVLSIHLRERGSPESKPVGKRYNHKTGE